MAKHIHTFTRRPNIAASIAVGIVALAGSCTDRNYDESCGNGEVEPGEFCHVLRSQTAAGIDPCALTIADFDHDGLPDVAVPNSDFDRIDEDDHVAHVLLGEGNGALARATAFPAGHALPVGIAAGDFNADGDPDVVVAKHDGDSVNVLYGDRTGNLGEPVFMKLDYRADAVAAADIDSNGSTDFLVVSGALPGVALVRANRGYLGPAEPVILGAYVTAATFADVDGDGSLDVLAAIAEPPQVAVLHGEGDGSFGEMTQHDVSAVPSGVISADLDDDGHEDLVVANFDGTADILYGRGQRAFSPARNLQVGSQLQSVVAGDFDTDGRLDLAFADDELDVVIFMTATADREFEKIRTISVGKKPVSIHAADFDLDGVVDVAVADQLGNTVSVVAGNP